MSIRADTTQNDFKFTKYRMTSKLNNITPKRSLPKDKLLVSHHNHHPNQQSNAKTDKDTPQKKSPKSHDQFILTKKEKQLMSKLLKTKMEQCKRRRWRTQHAQQRLTLKKNTIGDFQNLQFQILKPTDKLFHKLENMRLAEKILLAKPSINLNRASLSTFYKKQKSYEINIRKMPPRYHSKSKHRRLTNKKQWID